MKMTELRYNDALYPERLRALRDAPRRLYCAGDLSLLRRRCVCVVGSRRTTAYGRRVAADIAAQLARCGIAVVSGLARGIDACAHRGALEVGGATIAVLGTGIDVPYPWVNRDLRAEILDRGLLISEYSPGTPATRYTFPQRNRILAGISECGAVVEAGHASGALITAELLNAQNKDVYAVPGCINNVCSLGCNQLIRDGAIILTTIGDLLDALGLARPDTDARIAALGEEEKKIYEALRTGGEKTADELAQLTELGAARVTGLITVLEIKGLVYTSLGKVGIAK
ncbi:MAG: DNA-processing protein DprA [Anaerovoracaceae bacterium]|jgi:DNA processing protein